MLLEEDVPTDEVLDEGLELDETSAEFVHELVNKLVLFTEQFCDVQFFPYQVPIAYRLIESIVLGDGEELTLIATRQSGKSEVLSAVIAAMMVILPKLAPVYPVWLEKFSKGFWVGIFAPTEEQADTVFGRVVQKLTSDHAMDFLLDPEIDDKASSGGARGKGKLITLKNAGSLCRMQTCNPKAKIESKTYHFTIVDEAQEADEVMITKSIKPMLAFNNGTICLTGTANRQKSYFYKMIQYNKRRMAQGGRNFRPNHFEYDYKVASKYNKNYAAFIAKEKLRIGEDSEEFRMSYCATLDTPILTADLRYVEAGTIRTGDRLLAFDEERPSKGAHRRFKESVVLDSQVLLMDCVTLRLSNGTEVTCTPDHQWLVRTAGGRTEWKRTDQLVPTDMLHQVTHVWTQSSPTYEIGYLAAAFDGEGCLNTSGGKLIQICFAQRENAMLEEVKRCLDVLGFNWNIYRHHSTDVVKLTIGGGRSELLRFLGTVRPLRLLDKFNPDLLGTIGRHDNGGGFEHPTVVSVTPVGPKEVMAIKTSTRTYIANGLASHNCNQFLLDRGMFVTEERLERLYDPSMPLVRQWWRTPIVVGIDVARSNDSTVATAVWVDWDHPDPFGFHEHRVLNWLEINNVEWEQQYYQLIDFIRQYNVMRVGVDSQGVGGAVAERMTLLLPDMEVVSVMSDAKSQHERWVHLTELIQRDQLVVPGHSKAKRTRPWKRFNQQMSDLEKVHRGPYMLAEAPNERNAYDDYADSLAIACAMTIIDTMPTVQVASNPFYR